MKPKPFLSLLGATVLTAGCHRSETHAVKSSSPQNSAIAESEPAAESQKTATIETNTSKIGEQTENGPTKNNAVLLSLLGNRGDAERLSKAEALIASMSPGEIAAAVAQLPQVAEEDLWFVIPRLVRKWAETDPQAAMAWAAQIPNPGFKQAGMRAAYNSWAEKDPQAAVATILALPAGTDRDFALSSALRHISETDAAAASVLAQQLPEGQTRAEIISSIAGTFATQSPDKATEWVMQLPEGQERDGALRNVAANIGVADPVKTSAWLETIPVGSSRDNAVYGAVLAASATDFESASNLAATISDPGMRSLSLLRTTSLWLNKDESAASAWIKASSSLTDADKVDLLRQIKTK